jgi:hypothetical protein
VYTKEQLSNPEFKIFLTLWKCGTDVPPKYNLHATGTHKPSCKAEIVDVSAIWTLTVNINTLPSSGIVQHHLPTGNSYEVEYIMIFRFTETFQITVTVDDKVIGTTAVDSFY